jgi:hypothetical protein
MPWERGYYYRAWKIGGKVKRRYVGRGPVADVLARVDAERRQQREEEARRLRQLKSDQAALDAQVQPLLDLADLVARAALLAAGCYQHHREWRKRRG